VGVIYNGEAVRYLPSFIIGLIFTLITDIVFYLSARYSPIVDFLIATPELNANSFEYVLFGLHDMTITLLLACLCIIFYKKVLKKFPLNFKSALIIQLPTIFIVLMHTYQRFQYSSFPMANSIYAIVEISGRVLSCVSVLLIYWLVVAYNKQINHGKY